jgi:hypothetical protein
MLLPLLVPGGHLALMAGATAWLAAERLEAPAPPSWRMRLPERAARIAFTSAARRLWPRPRPRPDPRHVSILNI